MWTSSGLSTNVVKQQGKYFVFILFIDYSCLIIYLLITRHVDEFRPFNKCCKTTRSASTLPFSASSIGAQRRTQHAEKHQNQYDEDNDEDFDSDQDGLGEEGEEAAVFKCLSRPQPTTLKRSRAPEEQRLSAEYNFSVGIAQAKQVAPMRRSKSNPVRK